MKRRLSFVGGAAVAIFLISLIAVLILQNAKSDAALATANAFLTAIRENRSSDAYRMQAWETQRLANPSSFVDREIGSVEVVDWDLFIVSQNSDFTTACGEIKSTDGWHVINLNLIYRDDKWQIWTPEVSSFASQERQTNPSAKACLYF